MFRKLSARTLIIVLTLLLLIIAGVFINDKMKGDRTFRAEIYKVDTANITAIHISRMNEKEKLTLLKEENIWKVNTNNATYRADNNMVQNVLAELSAMKVESVVASEKSQWHEYNVSDSVGTLVSIDENGEEVVSFVVGRFSYSQTANTNPYGGKPNVSTFVRVQNDDNVYSVSGFLSMAFNRTANDFRNKLIVPDNKQNWEKLTFTYPADSSYTLLKSGKNWILNGKVCDSTRIEGFLSSLADMRGFDLMTLPPAGKPIYTLKIEGKMLTAPIVVSASPADTANRVCISSSANPGTWFSGRSGIQQRIFKSSKSLQ
jgi:hypothetical protein